MDVKTQLKTKVKADLTLLSDVVLNSNPIKIDTIIILELVHLLIDSEQTNQIIISENSREIVSAIYKLIDCPNEDITRHAENFYQRLTQACITYQNRTKNFESVDQAIRSAMRF